MSRGKREGDPVAVGIAGMETSGYCFQSRRIRDKCFWEMQGSMKSARVLRHRLLKKELERFIHAGKAGEMLPSYTQMIRQYGVGQNTIDRVIREFDQAGLIVRKPCKGIYISQRAARKTIGFVLGRDIFAGGQSPIASMLMEQCRARAKKGRENFNYYLDLPETTGALTDIPLHQELADDIQNGRLDGVILVWSHGPSETAWIRSHNVPIVSLGGEGDIEAHSVIIDYLDLIARGTAALANAGAKSIAWITPSGYLRQFGFKRDIDVFRKTLSKHGLVFHPEFVLEDHSKRSINAGGTMSNEEMGFELMTQFLSARRHPRKRKGSQALPVDGLLCEDDMFMRGALTALHLASISLNDDLVIATHANKGSTSLKNYENHLILLEIDPREVVDAMFDLLEPMMKNKSSSRKKIYIGAHLRSRRS